MAIYAIADLHLSFADNKKMDIFGENWIGHENKIKENWLESVSEQDLVVLPGDFSWAMYLKDTYEDFKYLNDLPGKKLLLRGNHDYWWTTLTKMKNFLNQNNFQNIYFLQNNSFYYDGKIIVGTRGWSEQEEKAEKILKRENLRLEMSIKDGIEKYGENCEIIAFIHYPPFNRYEEIDLSFIETMKKYNIKKCIYGHIHGKEAWKEALQGEYQGIDFKLVSSDYTDFKLIKIN